jgi:hypothetical protein
MDTKLVGQWVLEEATAQEFELSKIPESLAEMANGHRVGRLTRFTPSGQKTSTLQIEADGSFEHEEKGNRRFSRFVVAQKSVSNQDSHWRGQIRGPMADEGGLAVLERFEDDMFYLDIIDLEGDFLLRRSYLVWDGILLTLITGRYRRGALAS